MWENFWLKILDLRGDLLAALFCASVVILMLANGHMFYADELPRPVLGAISALAVASFFLWLVKTIMVIAAVTKKKFGARRERLHELGLRALRLNRNISDDRGYSTPEFVLQSYRSELLSLFLHLRKDGFEAPQPQDGLSNDEVLNQCSAYLDSVGRLLAEGHLENAEGIAKSLLEKFNGK